MVFFDSFVPRFWCRLVRILPVFRPLTLKNPLLVVWFGVIFFPRVKPYSLDGTKWPFALLRAAHAYDSPAQVPCIRSVPLL